MQNTRKPFVGGNHKMNGTKASLKDLLEKLNASIGHIKDVEVVVAPPAPYLEYSKTLLKDSVIGVSAQNCHDKPSGAFTGETSFDMLRDLGVDWVILGHSERRHVFGESDALLTSKVSAAQDAGLRCILCVGETLAEREQGKTNAVISSQMEAWRKGVKDWSKVVVAYEPVWAIGTGKVASPQQAQEAHEEVRRCLQERGADVRVIYGGSVTQDNAQQLAQQKDVDGFLVGGASLKADQFANIVKSKSKTA